MKPATRNTLIGGGIAAAVAAWWWFFKRTPTPAPLAPTPTAPPASPLNGNPGDFNGADSFVSIMWAYAIQQVPAGWPQRQRSAAAMVAMWALETGWGRTFTGTYNVGNLTAGGSWRGPVKVSGDLEYATPDAVPKNITQRWRCYTSYEAFAKDWLYGFILGMTRYKTPTAKFGTPSQHLQDGNAVLMYQSLCSTAEGGAGYYTLPLAQGLPRYKGVYDGVTQRLRAQGLASNV